MFAAVFFVVWFGAAVVTLNAQLLGGTMYVSNGIKKTTIWNGALVMDHLWWGLENP